MKRLIAALGVGWGLIYATNHLLLPRAPTESKVAVQSEQTSSNRSINSWGPYLSDVKPEPNNMAETSLKSRQTQEPAASEAELMPSSSRDIIDHAEAVALEERTLRVARVENPPTSVVRQHDGSPSSLQDLKPNSEVVALEERTLRVARVENPPTSAVRQHDGSQSSLQDLKPNSEAVALEERTLRAARVENPLTAAEREHEGMQSSPQDIKPNSAAVTSAERSLRAGNRPAGTASIARLENPPTPSRKPRSPVAAKARIAQATADQDLPWRVGSASHRRGVGLFIFAPPGF
jgi:hypothetical protein